MFSRVPACIIFMFSCYITCLILRTPFFIKVFDKILDETRMNEVDIRLLYFFFCGRRMMCARFCSFYYRKRSKHSQLAALLASRHQAFASYSSYYCHRRIDVFIPPELPDIAYKKAQ